MTRVLLVKLSSLGDVVHALPALTDARRALPDLRVDWAIEDAYAPIARLHPAVGDVLPVALRRWRRAPWAFRREAAAALRRIRAARYDLVLDAQGLMKSALIACAAYGVRAGFDLTTAREGPAGALMDRGIATPRARHAIDRLRFLFARALGYVLPDSPVDYGLSSDALPRGAAGPYALFLHGTSWNVKGWPEAHWRALCERARADGLEVRLAHGGDDERARAHRIAGDRAGVHVLPAGDLAALLPWIANAERVVAVDTGLGHLAAALGRPVTMLYGPTDAVLTGARGRAVTNLRAGLRCSPCLARRCRYDGALPVADDGRELWPACMGALAPARVWAANVPDAAA